MRQILYFYDRRSEDGIAKIYPCGSDLTMVIDIMQAIKQGTPVYIDPAPVVMLEGRRDR